MDVIHWKDCEDKQIDKFPYRGEKLDVIGTSIRGYQNTAMTAMVIRSMV